jgi:predicted ester cyclase
MGLPYYHRVISMGIEENLRWVDRALEAFNAHDVEGFMDFYAESAVHNQPSRAVPIRGREAIREDYVNSTFRAFPDIRFEKKRSFGQGEWVCIEGIFKGTHKGPLQDDGDEIIPPTNKEVQVPICMVIRMKDARAKEVHEYNDQLGFLRQLGLMDG